MPIRDDLLNPIPGANPSGENLRYAPVYDQIKEARREEAEVAQGDWQREIKKADWVQVVKLCSESLAKKSKDLQIAGWLTEGITRREGFSGLGAGLDLIRGMLENFWDTVYPEIEDGDLGGRVTPLDWLGSKLDETIKRVPLTRTGRDWFAYKESRSVPYESDPSAERQQARATAIEEGKLTPEGFDEEFKVTPKAFYQQAESDVAACLESLECLNGFCEEKFGDDSPNFTGMRRTLEDVKQTVHVLLVKKRETEPDEAGAVEEEAGEQEPAPEEQPRQAEAPAPPKRKASRGPEPADADDAAERVAAVARWMRAQDPANPAPYLAIRGLRWGEVRAAGEGYEPDGALLEPAPTETRQELKRLASAGEWQQVLDLAEETIAGRSGRASLDLHRYAVQALENLGYYAAAWAIKSEIKALLADVPRLPDMTLTDDTPTANAETRAWMNEFAKPATPEPQWEIPTRRPEASVTEEEAPPDAFQVALEAARGGRAQEAMEILSREAAQEPSGRGRFQRKVQLAQICLGAGKDPIARPILEELAQEIERRKLEEWEEPDTVAHALALLYRCMERLDAPPEEKQRIYGRICRLDPVQALSIST